MAFDMWQIRIITTCNFLHRFFLTFVKKYREEHKCCPMFIIIIFITTNEL